MDSIRITKEGFKYFCWDGDIRQYAERPIRSLLRCLREACQIDSDVTLGDIFKAVDRDEAFKHFIGDWAWCNVTAFHKEAFLATLTPSDLHCIEISKYFEWGKCGDDGETVHVIGVAAADEDGSTHYALDFTPVNELQHLSVVLKPTMEIRKDCEKIAEIEATFSLLDVLGGIYYEISFNGDPAERDERSHELQDVVREIKKGTAELIPFEAVFDKEYIN